MNKWITAIEKALTEVNKETDIPYDFQRFENGVTLPDAYIVYFLVSNPPTLAVDGKEKASTPRIQISFYFRRKKDLLTIPGLIDEKMVSSGFSRGSSGNLPYDIKSGHYGFRMEFNYYERR